jgi:hypothetical protein
MTLEMMKELFGIAHVRDDEEEVPNMKCMGIGEEVSLSQPITVAVLPEEEEVPVLQGLCQLPLEEEDVPILIEWPPCHGPTEGRSPTGPPCHGPTEGRGGPSPVGPLSWSRRKEGDALSLSMTMAPMMKALYHPS